MTRRIPVQVNGRKFDCVKAAADQFGVSLQTAARRLRDGWSPEQAFGLVAPPPKVQPKRGIRLNTSAGEFRTAADAAAHFGIESATIYARFRNGWTANQAVGIAPPPKRTKAGTIVVCNGATYLTICALAQAYGKSDTLVSKRIRSGWTPEQAVELSPRPPRFRDVRGDERNHSWKRTELIDDRTVPAGDAGQYKVYVVRNNRNGREYVGITITPLWARFNGHKVAARKGVGGKLYNAMRKYGEECFNIELVRNDAANFRELQEQETAEIDRRGTVKRGYNISLGGSIGTPKGVTVGDVVFGSYGAAAQYFGIDPSVFNLRMGRLGWTPEQAAEIEPRAKYAHRRVVVSGIAFRSLKAAAEHFGVSYQLAHDRLTSKGWTLEQALEVVKPPDTVKYRGVSVVAFGHSFPSLDECARHFGIKPASLRRRVSGCGDPIESAVTHFQNNPKAGAQAKNVVAFGQTFSSISDCADSFQVSVHSLKNRMRYQGNSIEDALKYLRDLPGKRGSK